MRSPAFAIDTQATPSLSVNLDWEPDSVIVSNPTDQSILINVGSNTIPSAFAGGSQLFVGPLSISTLPVTGASFGIAFYPAISAQGLANPPTGATLTFTAGVTTPQYGALPVTSLQIQQIAGVVDIVQTGGTQFAIGSPNALASPGGGTTSFTAPTIVAPSFYVVDYFFMRLAQTQAAGDLHGWVSIGSQYLGDAFSLTSGYTTIYTYLGGIPVPAGTVLSINIHNSNALNTYGGTLTLLGRIITP